MKKSTILLIIAVIAIVAVIGAVLLLNGTDKNTAKTNEVNADISNVDEESVEVDNEEDVQNNPQSLVGVFVPEDDFYLEGLFIILKNDEYTVYIKDPKGTYTDTLSASEVSNGKIESDLLGGTYSIEFTDDGVIFDSEMLLIEDLKMTKATGELDGIYENDNYYFVMFTMSNKVIRFITINKETGEYFTEKSSDNEVTANSAKLNGIYDDHTFDLSFENGKLDLKTNSTLEGWKDMPGSYELVTK